MPWGKGRAAAIAPFAAIAMVFALGACAAPDPFIYNPAAFDREHPDFAKTPETLSAVTVCYSKYGTQQRDVAVLAAKACGTYGAGIQFKRNTYTTCPLATPVGAEFSCVGAPRPILAGAAGGASAAGRAEGSAGAAGQPGTPLTGFHEGERPMGILFGRPADTTGGAPAAMPEAPAPAPVPADSGK